MKLYPIAQGKELGDLFVAANKLQDLLDNLNLCQIKQHEAETIRASQLVLELALTAFNVSFRSIPADAPGMEPNTP